MSKISIQQPKIIMQQYYKEFATVNGNVVQDKELRTISNEKEKIIMGHNGPYPIYEKQIILRNHKKSRKQKKSMKRKTIKRKPRNKK